jgi:hypothetical protein
LGNILSVESCEGKKLARSEHGLFSLAGNEFVPTEVYSVNKATGSVDKSALNVQTTVFIAEARQSRLDFESLEKKLFASVPDCLGSDEEIGAKLFENTPYTKPSAK